MMCAYRCPGSKSPLCPVSAWYGSLGFGTIWMGWTYSYFTVLNRKYMGEKQEIKNLQMFWLNYLLFNVIMKNMQHLETLTCTCYTGRLPPCILWVNQQNLGSISWGLHMQYPMWTFDLLGTLQYGFPTTMCHLHAWKPDVFEAKDESSLRVLAWTHICKTATLSPFKAPFLQRETCSPHNKGYAADCSPLIPCSPPDHLYPCADLHHTPSNARFWGQICHSAQTSYGASQEGSGPAWTSWEVWCQKLSTSLTLLHWVVLAKKEINSDCPYERESSFW